jgi:dynein light intermediate chain 1
VSQIYSVLFIPKCSLNRASILNDVKTSTKKAPAAKSLVVLGDNESGRTTLVAKLQGNEDPKRGAGLEYHYIDVKDDDQDGMKSLFKY